MKMPSSGPWGESGRSRMGPTNPARNERLGETIILTRNEVLHALEWYPNVDLFVVTEIGIEGRESDHPAASGGVGHVFRKWRPAEGDLTPLGYDYATRLGGATSASWVTVA
jgi:hypothetical protein